MSLIKDDISSSSFPLRSKEKDTVVDAERGLVRDGVVGRAPSSLLSDIDDAVSRVSVCPFPSSRSVVPDVDGSELRSPFESEK